MENAPASERPAERAAASVLASMRSATASGLREIELVVEERARRELARVRQTQPDAAARFEQAREDQLQHHRAAVRLQLQHVLAGVRIRRGEMDGQALVERLALRVEDGAKVRDARRQRPRADGRGQRRQVAPRRPHDAHGAASGRGGDRDDRIVQVGERGGGVHRGSIVAAHEKRRERHGPVAASSPIAQGLSP